MNLRAFLDFGLILPIFGLMGISVSVIVSSNSSLVSQQITSFIFGLFLFIFFSSVDYRLWRKFAWLFYGFSLILLLLTYANPLVRGSNRWIEFATLRFQPSEIIKPFITIYFIFLLIQEKKLSLIPFLKPFFFLFPIFILIFKQPDLGNFLVYFFTFLAIEIMVGIPLIYIVMIVISSILGFPFIWRLLQQYQKSRILTFLNPHTDSIGAGYNAIQAMIAIGSGKIFGLGLGRGTQSHLLFLPEYHTDFIFASIGEELGFFGGFLVILFYFILLGRIIKISMDADDQFGKLLSIGIFAQIFIQVLINIGMNLGVVPITGITLPLLSYGGSSIIAVFIGLGMVASIGNIHKRQSTIVIR
jgi:rod shape determining protein RodA